VRCQPEFVRLTTVSETPEAASVLPAECWTVCKLPPEYVRAHEGMDSSAYDVSAFSTVLVPLSTSSMNYEEKKSMMSRFMEV
jgi:hypothetical protein